MRDIAKAAGVSVMTVSSALRHHPRVARDTARLVRRTARKLGYRPNPLVSAFISSIRHGKTMKAPPSIALINMYADREATERSPLYQQRLAGAKARCKELGFGFAVVEPVLSGLRGRRLTEVLLYNNFCGLMISTMPVTGMSIDLDWSLFPAVALGHTMHQPELNRVEVNHFGGMKLVLGRLQALGYQRIGLATFVESSRRIGDRYLGAYHAFAADLPAAQQVKPLRISRSEITPKIFSQWMRREKPDVIVDAGQRRYQRLAEAVGLRIPQDVAYVTSNWIESEPYLAGMHQHPREVGAAAVDVLGKHIFGNERGIPSHRVVTLVDASWVDGVTAPPRV